MFIATVLLISILTVTVIVKNYTAGRDFVIGIYLKITSIIRSIFLLVFSIL